MCCVRRLLFVVQGCLSCCDMWVNCLPCSYYVQQQHKVCIVSVESYRQLQHSSKQLATVPRLPDSCTSYAQVAAAIAAEMGAVRSNVTSTSKARQKHDIPHKLPGKPALPLSWCCVQQHCHDTWQQHCMHWVVSQQHDLTLRYSSSPSTAAIIDMK